MTDTKQLTLDADAIERAAREIEDLGAFKTDRDGYRVELAEHTLIDPGDAAAIVRALARSGLARQEPVVVGVTPNVAAGLIEAAFREGFAWCQQDDFDIESGWDDSQAKADADAARRR